MKFFIINMIHDDIDDDARHHHSLDHPGDDGHHDHDD